MAKKRTRRATKPPTPTLVTTNDDLATSSDVYGVQSEIDDMHITLKRIAEAVERIMRHLEKSR